MLSHVLRTIRRHDLLVGPHGNRLLCAVSGGPDSMALLACLWELAPRLHLELEVATVHHGLRPEAEAEMALVAARSADLGLPWHPVRVDVPAARQHVAEGGSGGPTRAPGRARSSKVGGVQEVARRLRLAALVELAQSRQLGSVALGHTADDQVETILFRILRGTGVKGLAGIPVRRGSLIRPLLDVTRAQVMSYLEKRSLPFVTDPSNADPHYARSRLRHQVLPLLRNENPRLDRALRGLARDALRVMESGPQGALSGDETQFQNVPALVEMLGDGSHVPGRLVNEIASAARDGRGTRTFDVAGERRVTVSYGNVSVAGASAASIPLNPAAPVLLSGPGSYPFDGGTRILVREAPGTDADHAHDAAHAHDADHVGDDEGSNPRHWCWFDQELLGWPLLARLRRPGDRMLPRGGRGSRKLSDLLIDAKIPRAERSRLPVMTTAGGAILFVPGLRPSQTAAPSPGTVRRIGLAVVTKWDHDALVDPSIVRGNTGRHPYPLGRTLEVLGGQDRGEQHHGIRSNEQSTGREQELDQVRRRRQPQASKTFGTSQFDDQLDERKARAPGT